MEYKLLKISSENLTPIPNINLLDKVIIFSIDDAWIAYPLKYFISEPMIQIKTFTLLGDVKSLKVILVEADIQFYSYEGDKLLFTYNNVIFDLDTIPADIKKTQCKIQSLRSALILVGDLSYIKFESASVHPPLIRTTYYDQSDMNDSDNVPIIKSGLGYEPKTLCTIISYLSKRNVVKYTILVGKSSDEDNQDLWGYEPKKNKIDFYLEKMTDKIIEKEAFIFNMLYYMAIRTYKDARIIEV